MTLLILGVIWTLFGIMGIKGNVNMSLPSGFENQEWTLKYKRLYSLGYFIMGIPYLLAFVAIEIYDAEIGIIISDLLIILFGLPGLLYDLALEKKFNTKIDNKKSFSS